jgi:hypothetical protein
MVIWVIWASLWEYQCILILRPFSSAGFCKNTRRVSRVFCIKIDEEFVTALESVPCVFRLFNVLNGFRMRSFVNSCCVCPNPQTGRSAWHLEYLNSVQVPKKCVPVKTWAVDVCEHRLIYFLSMCDRSTHFTISLEKEIMLDSPLDLLLFETERTTEWFMEVKSMLAWHSGRKKKAWTLFSLKGRPCPIRSYLSRLAAVEPEKHTLVALRLATWGARLPRATNGVGAVEVHDPVALVGFLG